MYSYLGISISLMSQKILLLLFVAGGEFKKKIWWVFFSFFKPIDEENVLQLSPVLFILFF